MVVEYEQWSGKIARIDAYRALIYGKENDSHSGSRWTQSAAA